MTAPETASVDRVVGALGGLRAALEADGYGLEVHPAGDRAEVRIVAGPEACEECLIPKSLMAEMIAAAMPPETEPPRLVYPGDGDPEAGPR